MIFPFAGVVFLFLFLFSLVVRDIVVVRLGLSYGIPIVKHNFFYRCLMVLGEECTVSLDESAARFGGFLVGASILLCGLVIPGSYLFFIIFFSLYVRFSTTSLRRVFRSKYSIGVLFDRLIPKNHQLYLLLFFVCLGIFLLAFSYQF